MQVKFLQRLVKPVQFNRTFATYKTSTGLVGLPVQPDGNNVLINVSNVALEKIKGIPATSEYRIQVEKTLNFINKTCVAKGDDIKAIEDEIDLGQIEEVIEMVKDEMEAIDTYIENKMWDDVAEAQRDADDVMASMGDVIFFTDPKNKTGPVKK